MGIISRMRKQDAVWWPRVGKDAYGKEMYGPATPIKCRWEGSTETILNAAGEEVVCRALVFVDRATPAGGVLALGTVAGLTNQADPLRNANAWRIQRLDETPNFKATETLYEAYL